MRKLQYERLSLRSLAIRQGRAMVRVKNLLTGELATIGVCPACFNLRERRDSLLLQLRRLGYEVAYKEDALNGLFGPNSQHAPGCKYAQKQTKVWELFKSLVQRKRT